MARVVHSRPDSKGQVRSVKVATATTTLERPIQKLVLILENESFSQLLGEPDVTAAFHVNMFSV